MVFETIISYATGILQNHPLKYELYNLLFLTAITVLFPFFRTIFFASPKSFFSDHVSKRVSFFDYIKGIAILCVIMVHVTYFYTFTPPMYNKIAFVHAINALVRFALPIFFIASGILLNPIRKFAEILPFYERKVLRLLVPYLLVTVVIGVMRGYGVSEYLYQTVSGRILIPYYFVVVLFQLYFLFPFLSFIREKKFVLYLSFLISLACYIFPNLWSFKGVHLFGQYLFFFVYGMHNREKFLNYSFTSKDTLYWGIIVLIYSSLIFLFPIRYYNTQLFFGPAVLHLLFMGRKWIESSGICYKIISLLGKASFWIFLLHYQILDIIYGYFLSLEWNFFLGFFGFMLISIIVSSVVGSVTYKIYLFLSSFIGKHIR